MKRRPVSITLLALVLAGSASLWLRAQTPTREIDTSQIPIDADDIAGVVRSARGPEAGVWVIAETTDTPTKFRKIVVTDDQGRYLLPDLPGRATYKIWVRGYGLVDSTPVRATPGRRLALTAVPAADPRVAAQIYPANYWYSLINIPPEKDFPGTGPSGNGISPDMATQHHWINQIKANCNVCHQLGNKATREFPPALGTFASSVAAWDRRVQVGQDGAGMSSAVTVLGRARGLEMFANWTDRIAAGDVPPAPPRPKGLERNLVLTMWDWGGPATFAHDELGHRQAESDRERLRPDLRRGLGQRRVPHARYAGAHRQRAFLTQEFVISSQFKKETDLSRWNPTPCEIPAPQMPAQARGGSESGRTR